MQLRPLLLHLMIRILTKLFGKKIKTIITFYYLNALPTSFVSFTSLSWTTLTWLIFRQRRRKNRR